MSNSKDNLPSSAKTDKTVGDNSSQSEPARSQPQKEKLTFPVEANAKQQFSEQPRNTIDFSSDATSSNQ